ncbi:MAG: T9SS type A sorting domain-containing protein, partial [Bacteroidota bacterium]
LTGNVKVAGRGMYSDELFKIYGNDRNNANRTPFANTPPVGGNTWNAVGFWDCKVGVANTQGNKVTFAGLTNIGGRMGVVTFGNGKLDLINHKDVGYGGGVYQAGGTSKTLYKGCFIANDDDITYCHEDYDMNYCTTRNYYNGPSFQFGWAVNNNNNAKGKVNQHNVFPSDRPSNGSFGRNHGVFNSRLQAGELTIHEGGLFQNMTFWGKDNIWFHIGIWNDRGPTNPPNNKESIFGDKTFKNITIKNAGLKKNVIRTMKDPGTNQKVYVRFLHFDNFKIGNNVLNSFADGNHWQFNSSFPENNFNGTQVNTITFFTPQSIVVQPPSGASPIGSFISFQSLHSFTYVQADMGMPEVTLNPLNANLEMGSSHASKRDLGGEEPFEIADAGKFEVVDAGDGFVALRASNGYFVKADPERYGYVYTLPDRWRGDLDTKKITNDAKFVWHDLGEGRFALWSYALQRYVRRENNTGPDNPLYAASGSTEARTIFSYQEVSPWKNPPLGIESAVLSVYPNPAKHSLKIEGLEDGQVVHVFNTIGQEVLNAAVKGELSLSPLPPGVYVLKAEGFRPVQFIKQ